MPDAFEAARAQYAAWGLSSLSETLIQLSQQGLDDNSFLLKLRETPDYKVRFAGNTTRLAKGLTVLSEADYLDKEAALRAQLSDPEWGLPKDFYDSPDDYAKMIGTDMGAAEIQSRLQGVKNIVTDGAMTGVLDYARANYNLGTGDLIALWLDPERAAPVLSRMSKASAIGAAAKRTGYGNVSTNEAERLDALGITADQAQAGYADAAGLSELTQNVGGDQGIAAGDLTGAIFDQNDEARQRVEKAQNVRRARFQGGGSFAEGKSGIAGLGSANS